MIAAAADGVRISFLTISLSLLLSLRSFLAGCVGEPLLFDYFKCKIELGLGLKHGSIAFLPFPVASSISFLLQ